MAVFKCKMCGGSLEIQQQSVAVCEYCGTQQTLPKLDDDRRANLYDRANHFRRNNEFDKAMGIYEQILNEDNTDAEAYWSLVLCRYGIEYVEDPASHKRIPTVNRAQFTSVFDDDNYKSALQHADSYQRSIYEAEAKAINEIQKGILAISQKEEPFDVFICYKETDAQGRRTPDSVLANDLYHQLTQEGFKVFFSRITLEDKLGTAYEPYIFAALNSAKVMVVLGTKPEYFKAVWVRNEWSRYLGLIKQGQKKLLVPAYKDMDPYDLPEEFSHLQAQDMSKLGFMQDLIRGIKKIVQIDMPQSTVINETVISAGNNIAPLLKRAFMFLEDGEWDRADEFCEQVLNIDPECAQAYLGKLMAEQQVRKQESLKNCAQPFDNNNNYQKILRFADNELKTTLEGYIGHIKTRMKNERAEEIYNRAMVLASKRDLESVSTAAQLFASIPGWKDAGIQCEDCKKKVEEIKAKAEADRLERECLDEISRQEIIKETKRRRKNIAIVLGAIAVLVLLNSFVLYPLFSYCSGDYSGYIKTYGIKDFEIPDGVTTIQDFAFYNCKTLTSVIIPDSVTSIGEHAFMGCENLTFIQIPNSVTSIEYKAFGQCYNLTAITIPDSVTSIGSCVFSQCTSLTSVTIPNSIANISDSAFYDCYSLTDITIPEGVTRIGDYSFSYCASLTSITIPDSVTSIGTHAFACCDGLTNITIPYSVTSIGHDAFYNAQVKAVHVIIPDGVTYIQACAFERFGNVDYVTIPSSVTNIDMMAFEGCSYGTEITFQGTIAQWRKMDYGFHRTVHCTDGDYRSN